MTSPAPPPSGSFIATSRSSCAALREASGIKLPRPAIESWLLSLDRTTFDDLKSSHGLKLPLAFPDLQAEVNFLSLLSLFNFLSGYRAPLHHYTGAGAWESILKLFISLYIAPSPSSSTPLSAKALQSVHHEQLASILSLPLHSEAPHPTIQGLVVGTPRSGMGWEIVELLHRTLEETGKTLDALGKKDLGELVLEILAEAQQKGSEADKAEHFVERLVTAVPGFFDAAEVPSTNGTAQPVYLFKKAYFLVLALYQRLSSDSSIVPIDAFAARLPMFVDNVIPTMLLRFGLVDLSSCSDEALKKWGEEMRGFVPPEEGSDAAAAAKPVVEGPQLEEASAYRMRAAGLEAGETICRVAHELADKEGGAVAWLRELNEVDLDGYLWSVAKADKALRKVPRMAQRGTNMY